MVKLLPGLAAVALVAACGTSGGPADADVEFAQAMIPHHEQAVEMAELVDGADASPEVRDLATRIEQAQGPEIATMRGWLDDWDVEAEDHGDHDMAGMMSGDDMTSLETARGARFDRLWLAMMIEHHEGAIQMAREVLAEGRDPDVAGLAKDVTSAQEAEITEMEELLDD